MQMEKDWARVVVKGDPAVVERMEAAEFVGDCAGPPFGDYWSPVPFPSASAFFPPPPIPESRLLRQSTTPLTPPTPGRTTNIHRNIRMPFPALRKIRTRCSAAS